MARLCTRCPFCDEVVSIPASVQEVKTMTKALAATRLAVAMDLHFDDHVDGIVATLAGVRG